MLCLQLVPIVWDLVSQRAIELVGEIIAQVVTIAHMRLSMGVIQAGLEAELGETRTRVERHEETLRAQSERIGDLAGSLHPLEPRQEHVPRTHVPRAADAALGDPRLRLAPP